MYSHHFGSFVLCFALFLFSAASCLSADPAAMICDSVPAESVLILEPDGEPNAHLVEFGRIYTDRFIGRNATQDDRDRLFALFEADPCSESLLPFVIASLGNSPTEAEDFPRLVRLARETPHAFLLNLTLGELLLAASNKRESDEEKKSRLEQAYGFLSHVYHESFLAYPALENEVLFLAKDEAAEKKKKLDRKFRHAVSKYMMVCLLQEKWKKLEDAIRCLKSFPALYEDPELSALALLMLLGRMENSRPVLPLPLIGPIPDDAFSLQCDFAEIYPHFLNLLESGAFKETRTPGELTGILARMGKVEDLRRALLSWILLTDGASPEPLEILAAVEEIAGRRMTAARLAELALATGRSPDPVRMIFAAANTCRNAGDPARALALLRKYEAKIPDKTALTGSYLQLYLMLHDIPSALKMAAQLPENHAKYIQIMLIQKDQGAWKAAAESGKKALDFLRADNLKLTSNAFYLIYCEILEKNGDVEGVRAVLEPLIRESPEDADLLNFLGYVLADHNRDLDVAQDLIERALRKKPDNAAILDSMAWVLFRRGKIREAKTFILQSLDRCGESPDATLFDHAGDIFHALGEGKKAVEFWNRALRLLEESSSDPELEKSVRKKLSAR